MRWTWLIPRLILMSLLWAIMAFGFDPFLRYSAIQTAQSITGARADIEQLTTGFFPPVVSINNVALASASAPGTNLVEFAELSGHLAGAPLLRKSFVLEEAKVTGIRFGTVRNDDGQLEILPTEPQEPSWLTEKLSEIGDEWLEQLVVDVRQQLDPNTLETWRTSQQLKVKWEQRVDVMQRDLKTFEPRVKQLQTKMEQVKSLPPVNQVEQYLQLATEGQRLVQEAQNLQNEVRRMGPEVQQDLRQLDVARQNDQRQIVQKVRQLTPSPRRITESLIGPQMYQQLHQALSWLQMGTDYQKQLRDQTKVERHRGRDFEFSLLNPTPRLHCRRIEMSGELTIAQQLSPFHAVLTDATSDPKLVGQPMVFRMNSSGQTPLQLAIRHDATADLPITDVIAELHEFQPRNLRIGDSDSAVLTAALSDLNWSARVRVQEDTVAGAIKLHAKMTQSDLSSDRMPAMLRSEVAGLFQTLESIDATVNLAGDLHRPQIEIQSDLGHQIANGMKTAFQRQGEQLKAAMTAKVTEIAQQQKQKLTQELSTQYRDLLAKHADTQKQLQGAQQLLAAARAGESNPGELFRQVSGTGLIPQGKGRKAEKVQRQLDQAGQLLEGLGGGLFR